jgi:hypothetical protein
MSIWNKILIGFVCVGSLAFFYLAMRTLKTQEHWRNYAYACEDLLARDHEFSVAYSEGGDVPLTRDDKDATLEDNDAVRQLRDFYKKYQYTALTLSGETKWPDFKKAVLEAVSKTGKLDRKLLAACKFKTEKTSGIAQARVELNKLTLNRPRVWEKFSPLKLDDQGGKVSVSDGQPDPQGIDAKMLVYVFDREVGEKGSEYKTYLGEFSVESVGAADRPGAAGEKQAVIQLAPTKELAVKELTALKDSVAACGKNTRVWVLFERMPLDGHDVFADRSDDEKEKLGAEYVRNGQPATWEQMEEWGVKGMLVDEAGKPLVNEDGSKKAGEKGFYRRPLRDYQGLFTWYDNQRIIMHDLLATINHDLQQATDAAVKAQQDVTLCKQDAAALTAEVNRLGAERKLILAHFAAVTQRLNEFVKGWKKPDGSWQKGLTDLLKDNEEQAKEISRRQFEAVRRIDERTRTMASSGDSR